MTIRAEQVLGGRLAEELADAHAASSRPGGASVELEQCRATLSGLEEAYQRERGLPADSEVEESQALGAVILQRGSPTLDDSPEGSDTEEDQAVGYVDRVSRG